MTVEYPDDPTVRDWPKLAWFIILRAAFLGAGHTMITIADIGQWWRNRKAKR